MIIIEIKQAYYKAYSYETRNKDPIGLL